MSEPSLQIQAGFSSLQGRRGDNQDFVCWVQPEGMSARLHGAVALVADGMGGAKGGRVAAETCARLFVDGYYNMPETLGVGESAARCLESANQWVHAVGRRDPALQGMATTFSALVLRHRQAHLIHVGDSRIYRLRGDSLEKLTEDHNFKHPDLQHVLYRAVGIEETLCAESVCLPLEAHDRFLICSDGLHGTLREAELREVLRGRMSPDSTARQLAELALANGSQDNITALVVDIIGLPPPDRSALREALAALPLLELPRVGQTVDGYVLEKLLCSGRHGSLFLATEAFSQTPAVLKFPHPRMIHEREYYEAFLREAWIGARVHSPWVGEIIELPPGRQSRLYIVMPYYAGQTLEQRLQSPRPVSLEEGIGIALPLCKAIHALHRMRIIHRDIKPDNVQLLDSGGLRLLDLGVARLPAWDGQPEEGIPGTASYMAPEQFAGERGTVATDVYAAGVTLFRLFAQGHYPYGEIEPFSTPRFHGKGKALNHYRPDLPSWLDAALSRAVAVDPQDRHADIMELAYELEHGLAKGGQAKPQQRAWYERNPLLFWKLFSLVLFGLLMVCAGRLALHDACGGV